MALEEQDLTQIKELIEKNNESLISSKLPELIKSNNEDLQTMLANQINGANKRWRESLDEITNVIPKQESIVDAVKASLSSSNNNDSTNNNSSEDNGSDSSLSSEADKKYKQLLTQMDNQANAIKQLTSSVEEERKLRQQAEHLATQEKVYGSFISNVSSKVVDPRNFLRTLIENKKIEEKNGELVVAVPGKIDVQGNQLYEPAANHIDTFLTKDYSYFAKPREGNGSGSSPGENYQQKTTSKYFSKEIDRDSGKLDATYLVKAFSDGKEEEIFTEAKNL